MSNFYILKGFLLIIVILTLTCLRIHIFWKAWKKCTGIPERLFRKGARNSFCTSPPQWTFVRSALEPPIIIIYERKFMFLYFLWDVHESIISRLSWFLVEISPNLTAFVVVVIIRTVGTFGLRNSEVSRIAYN